MDPPLPFVEAMSRGELMGVEAKAIRYFSTDCSSSAHCVHMVGDCVAHLLQQINTLGASESLHHTRLNPPPAQVDPRCFGVVTSMRGHIFLLLSGEGPGGIVAALRSHD